MAQRGRPRIHEKVKTNVENMADAIMEGLKEYAGLTQEVLAEKIKASGKEVKKEIEATAPKHEGAYNGYQAAKKHRQPGKYAKSWRVKTKEFSSSNVAATVYSTQYSLAHLLEKGHAKRGGGRTRAFPHIAPAEEKAAKHLVEEIKKELESL